ncbi:MAG: tRNA (cytidine(34)-2'-O)-methyltransferase [Pseudomonadales bacterium]|nr:tRNA (cytidine(34)-2'-O)-methyltransferase [Pseudomonadales bacterium]RZV60080.1 MAG: tRNA (cytidine(34)-2'-O)-methyltransferase [Pseudomonadales bacterium]
MPINIALYEPEIAPNTGNIIRLCANTGAALHILGKPGFEWDDKRLRRAGLDYHEWADVAHWPDYESFIKEVGAHSRVFAMSTKGGCDYHRASFQQGDSLLFGPETRGLPNALLRRFGRQEILRIPMRPDSRSLNLSNSVAIATYEAWRQLGFTGAKPA